MPEGDGARAIGLGKDREGHGAVHELEGGEGHAIAALGRVLLQPADQTEEKHAHGDGRTGQLGGGGGPETAGHLAELVERVAGEIKAEDLLLVAEELLAGPLGHLRFDPRRRRRPRHLRRRQGLEEGRLPLVAVPLAPLPDLHGLVESREEPCARLPERVEGAGFDQALHHTSIDEAEIDTPAEVGQAREGSRLARLDDRVDGGGAHVLDGGEAEVNGLAEHGEACARDAHGGRLHPESHAAALFHVLNDLVGLLHFGGEQSSHELDGIVRLEIGGLVGDEAVTRRVRVVHGHAIGDKACRPGNLEVVRCLFACEAEAPHA